MTILFAAAKSANSSPVASILSPAAIVGAANDNGEVTTSAAPSEQMLRAALRHFAEHGLGAAREARSKAEQAFFAGDRHAYDWWLGITRTLDRRLAMQAEKTVIAPVIAPKAANEETAFQS
ncbi:MAG: hypothetical protein QNJ15_12975 [Erythrobacter sp.]|nr:hypothetical protein [Erythrobacter sp.]